MNAPHARKHSSLEHDRNYSCTEINTDCMRTYLLCSPVRENNLTGHEKQGGKDSRRKDDHSKLLRGIHFTHAHGHSDLCQFWS